MKASSRIRRRQLISILCTSAVACLALGRISAAQQEDGEDAPRQFYSEWKKHGEFKYHYRSYNYKPSESSDEYRVHYVVLHESRPDYLYFYNPYKKKYWGRCPAHQEGRQVYSLLPAKYRRERLSEIPESAFPPLGKLPPIPESTDGATLVLPPDGLPDGF